MLFIIPFLYFRPARVNPSAFQKPRVRKSTKYLRHKLSKVSARNYREPPGINTVIMDVMRASLRVVRSGPAAPPSPRPLTTPVRPPTN